MLEDLIVKLQQPDLSFFAIYVSVLVLIAYVGLLALYLSNQKLKAENSALKLNQQNAPSSRHSRLDLNKTI